MRFNKIGTMNTSATLEQDKMDVLRYNNSIKSPDVMRRVKDAVTNIFVSIKPHAKTTKAKEKEETLEFLKAVQHAWNDSPSAEELVNDIYMHRQDFDDTELLKIYKE